MTRILEDPEHRKIAAMLIGKHLGPFPGPVTEKNLDEFTVGQVNEAFTKAFSTPSMALPEWLRHAREAEQIVKKAWQDECDHQEGLG